MPNKKILDICCHSQKFGLGSNSGRQDEMSERSERSEKSEISEESSSLLLYKKNSIYSALTIKL